MIILKEALLNPASVFKNPREVLENTDLSRTHKIKILKQWEYDAREVLVAEEENMQGADVETNLLSEITIALGKLKSWSNMESGSPNKQGGG